MKNHTRFTVTDDGKIQGPAGYMRSENFQETKREIENGTHVLIGAFAPGTPIATMLQVIFQTDYAAWVGEQQMANWSKAGA